MNAEYTPDYYRDLIANNGDTPHKVDRERFWHMLEILFPEDWTRDVNYEIFRVPECVTGDLYTWMVRLGKDGDAEYWELIGPRTLLPHEISARIESVRYAEGLPVKVSE